MTSGWHSPSQLTALITLDFCLSSWAWRYILNEHRIYCNKSCKLHVIYASLCHDLSSCGNWSGEVDMVRGKKREWVLVWDLFIYLFIFLMWGSFIRRNTLIAIIQWNVQVIKLIEKSLIYVVLWYQPSPPRLSYLWHTLFIWLLTL